MDCNDLRDPITLETFTDPVIASDGITYDYKSLVKAISTDENPLRLSPFTKQPLRNIVFVNNFLRELLGLQRVPQDQIVRILYKKIDFKPGQEGISRQVFTFNPKDTITDPIIILLLQELNLWDKVLCIKVTCLREDSKDKWTIFGPPPIAEIKNRVVRFVQAIHFEKLFDNPENFGTLNLYVLDESKKKNKKRQFYTTIEHILGSLQADELFEDVGDDVSMNVGEEEEEEKGMAITGGNPKFIGATGQFYNLKHCSCRIVYRDLRCFDPSSYGGIIVHRVRPFDLKPFFHDE